ncbi:ferritin family protein [Clostridium estertheticum]|uniref:ferritin family protein n=1 Tax=Clostridium estertheticum TaxID=238834 RepID=UPI0013E926F8|nr:ferritin family protein [Clostridium estertheticum]MBZ9687971.1 ferritin family protein [Clostridium estertheticum]
MNNQELMIIKQAIINEVEGYEFYNMAASNSNSTEVKNAFLELAEEEMQHVVWLKDLFNKVKADNMVDFQMALIPEPTSPAIFKWENIDRKDAGIAVSAFGIGIQMEKASIEYYTKAAKETEIKEAKELFNILIKWETIHLYKFSSQYEELREEWWSEQGYAPF